MRGRSLRLDPADPGKVASNWDVVCVAPGHAQGDADYDRFVRKHRHLHAPADDGTLEAGVGHVHPDLSPFAPAARGPLPGDRPRDDGARPRPRRRPRALADRRAVRGARGRDARAAPARRGGGAAARRGAARDAPRAARARRSARCSAAAGRSPSPPRPARRSPRPSRSPALLPAAGLAAAALVRARRAAARHPAAAPLDRIALAVCDAYVALGELRPAAAASLAFEPRASGYLRCRLRDATPEESARVIAALDALLGPVERPRYLLSRLVAPPDPGPAALLRIAAGGRGTARHDLARGARRPRAPQGARGGARRRVAPAARPGRAAVHAARRPRPRGARRRGRAGLELRHAAPRRLAVTVAQRT